MKVNFLAQKGTIKCGSNPQPNSGIIVFALPLILGKKRIG